MANKITNTAYYQDIANAIRNKSGETNTYRPIDMAQAILDIPTGGGTDPGFEALVSGYASDSVTAEFPPICEAMGVYINQSSGGSTTSNEWLTNLEINGCDVLGSEGWGLGLVFAGELGSGQHLESITLNDMQALNIEMAGSPNVSPFEDGALMTFIAPGLYRISTKNYPQCTGVFQGARSLENVQLDSIQVLPEYMFKQCIALTRLDLHECHKIENGALEDCSSLETLIIRNSEVCYLDSELRGTRISSWDSGRVYVPAALVPDYETATNWSNLAGCFLPLEDYTDDGTTDGEFIG